MTTILDHIVWIGVYCSPRIWTPSGVTSQMVRGGALSPRGEKSIRRFEIEWSAEEDLALRGCVASKCDQPQGSSEIDGLSIKAGLS